MVKVFIANHPTEAHLITGLLQSRGITCHVQGETLFATRGGVPASSSTLPSVWVDDDAQAEEALAIIEESPTSATAAVLERPWRCGGCGELVEAQFTECWKCQTPRG